eukprot:15326284-Heterocapsa_arctica.AAC.1
MLLPTRWLLADVVRVECASERGPGRGEHGGAPLVRLALGLAEERVAGLQARLRLPAIEGGERLLDAELRVVGKRVVGGLLACP